MRKGRGRALTRSPQALTSLESQSLLRLRRRPLSNAGQISDGSGSLAILSIARAGASVEASDPPGCPSLAPSLALLTRTHLAFATPCSSPTFSSYSSIQPVAAACARPASRPSLPTSPADVAPATAPVRPRRRTHGHGRLSVEVRCASGRQRYSRARGRRFWVRAPGRLQGPLRLPLLRRWTRSISGEPERSLVHPGSTENADGLTGLLRVCDRHLRLLAAEHPGSRSRPSLDGLDRLHARPLSRSAVPQPGLPTEGRGRDRSAQPLLLNPVCLARDCHAPVPRNLMLVHLEPTSMTGGTRSSSSGGRSGLGSQEATGRTMSTSQRMGSAGVGPQIEPTTDLFAHRLCSTGGKLMFLAASSTLPFYAVAAVSPA